MARGARVVECEVGVASCCEVLGAEFEAWAGVGGGTAVDLDYQGGEGAGGGAVVGVVRRPEDAVDCSGGMVFGGDVDYRGDGEDGGVEVVGDGFLDDAVGRIWVWGVKCELV